MFTNNGFLCTFTEMKYNRHISYRIAEIVFVITPQANHNFLFSSKLFASTYKHIG